MDGNGIKRIYKEINKQYEENFLLGKKNFTWKQTLHNCWNFC